MLLLLLFCPALSAAHVITDQICKFHIPGGLDAHWLISTYQLRARPTSVAIGGNCVCVLSSLSVLVQAARSLSHGGIEYRSHNGEILRDVS